MAEYVVVDKEWLENGLETISDSIRGKRGISGKLEFPSGMKNAVEEIQNGGNGGLSSGDIVKGWGATSITIASGSNTSARVNYGTELTHNNGTVSFVSSTQLTVSDVSSLEAIRGKYAQRTSSYGGTSTYGIYYIPEDAEFSSSGSTSNRTYTVSKANQMFVYGG